MTARITGDSGARWCETCSRYADHWTEHHTAENAAPVSCPDGGGCGHECLKVCWRVSNAGPLSIAKYPGDRWPLEVLREHAPERVSEAHVDERSSLRERLLAEAFRPFEASSVERIVREWLLSYVPYGLDPTEPLAELEGK